MEVEVRLTDPAGALRAAREALEAFYPTAPLLPAGRMPARSVYLGVDGEGRWMASPWRTRFVSDRGLVLGRARIRRVSRVVVLEGAFLGGMLDELVEVFAEVGLRAIHVAGRKV